MTEVGSLQIGGSIDTSNIERGLTRVETGFKNVGAVGKGVNSDFKRMNQQASRLSKLFGKIAIVGAGAMVAIAKGSPAVAGAMAKMSISMGKLSRTLGEALRPAFEMASEALQGFVGWIQEHQGFISAFASDVVGGLTVAVQSLSTAWGDLMNIGIPLLDIKIGEGLQYLITTFGAELISGLIAKKFLGGPAGIAAAGVVSVVKSEAEGRGAATILGLTGGALGSPAGPVGIAIGFGIGALIGRGIDLFMGKQDRKNVALQLEDTQ